MNPEIETVCFRGKEIALPQGYTVLTRGSVITGFHKRYSNLYAEWFPAKDKIGLKYNPTLHGLYCELKHGPVSDEDKDFIIKFLLSKRAFNNDSAARICLNLRRQANAMASNKIIGKQDEKFYLIK